MAELLKLALTDDISHTSHFFPSCESSLGRDLTRILLDQPCTLNGLIIHLMGHMGYGLDQFSGSDLNL